jgi:hypothetical protein
MLESNRFKEYQLSYEGESVVAISTDASHELMGERSRLNAEQLQRLLGWRTINLALKETRVPALVAPMSRLVRLCPPNRKPLLWPSQKYRKYRNGHAV